MNSPAPHRFFYGWRVVGAVLVGQSFAVGLTTYIFGLFQVPLAEEFGVSRSVLSLALIGQMLLVAICSPFVGRALDQHPIRLIMVAGAIAMGSSYIAIGLTPWLPAIGLLFMVGTAAGMLGMGPLTAAKLVAAWFNRMRGRALGISAIGTSLGGAVAPPLIAAAIVAWGWRGAIMAAGATMLVVMLPIIWRIIHNRPEALGLHPDGAAEPPPPAAIPDGGWTFLRLARDRNFWVIGLSLGLLMGMVGSIIPNMPPIAAEFGVSTQRAALLISLLSLAGIAGKVGFGAIADLVDKRLLLWVTVVMLGSFLLLMMQSPGFVGLAFGGVVLGFSLGGLLPLWGALLADCYGSENFGQVMGLQSPLLMPPSFAGILFVPWCFDSTGSYQLAFTVYIKLSIAVAVLLLLLRLPRQQSEVSEPMAQS